MDDIGHLTKKKIGHLSNSKIPQMPDVPGEPLFYTETDKDIKDPLMR
jgi:hypothetical protein